MLGIFASVQNIHSYSLYTSNFIHCRYLARTVLVPFAYKAPPVTADSLEDILTNAPAAIPDAIQQIGQDVVAVDSSTLNNMAEQIKDVVGDANIDSRLAMQYAFSVLCAQEVCRLAVVIARNSYVADCFNGRG